MNVASLYENPSTSSPPERPDNIESGPLSTSFAGLIHCQHSVQTVETIGERVATHLVNIWLCSCNVVYHCLHHRRDFGENVDLFDQALGLTRAAYVHDEGAVN